jgi:nitrogen-specific signal transduction histidine kinase
MRCTICGLLWVALMAHSTWAQPPQQTEYQRLLQSTALEQMRETVKYWEEMLSRELDLLKKGGSCEAKVDNARVTLAKYRHNLALQENRHEIQHEQNKLILEVREKEMKRWQQLADQGNASALEISDAQRKLAWARLFIARQQQNQQVMVEQLQIIVRLSTKRKQRGQSL